MLFSYPYHPCITVWYIYLHLVAFYGNRREIYRTWIVWVKEWCEACGLCQQKETGFAHVFKDICQFELHRNIVLHVSLQGCYHSNCCLRLPFQTNLLFEQLSNLRCKEVTYHLKHETLAQDVMLTPRENKIYHKSPRSYS